MYAATMQEKCLSQTVQHEIPSEHYRPLYPACSGVQTPFAAVLRRSSQSPTITNEGLAATSRQVTCSQRAKNKTYLHGRHASPIIHSTCESSSSRLLSVGGRKQMLVVSWIKRREALSLLGLAGWLGQKEGGERPEQPFRRPKCSKSNRSGEEVGEAGIRRLSTK